MIIFFNSIMLIFYDVFKIMILIISLLALAKKTSFNLKSDISRPLHDDMKSGDESVLPQPHQSLISSHPTAW